MSRSWCILLDVRLDIRWIQWSPALGGANNLAHQLRVSDGFSTFHDPHNCRLRFKGAVSGNSLMGLLILLLRLLGLDLVDLDAVLGMLEHVVHAKGVTRAHLLPFGTLGQDAVSGTRKRLQRPLELHVI